MDISSLSSLSTAQTQNASTPAKLQATIGRIVNTLSTANTTPLSDNIAQVSTAAQLQSSLTGLKQISSNLAHADTLTQVASNGVSQIQDTLTQMQSLADQADNTDLSADDSAALNSQFQQLFAQIDTVVNGTSFQGQTLLDGSVSGDASLSLSTLFNSNDDDTGSVSIPDLSAQSLFGGQTPDLLSASDAQSALSLVNNALSQTSDVSSSLSAFQQTLNFASASVDSVAANQQAAISIIDPSELGTTPSQLSSDNLQQNLSAAIASQGELLNPSLMDLVS